MVKESIQQRMEQNMMGSGKLANTTVLVHFNGLMAVYIKENGVIVVKMEEASFQVVMALFMKVNGSRESITEEASFKLQMARSSPVLLKMASS